LNRQLKRILPRIAKICRLPKDLRNTVNTANIGVTTDSHSQDPFHHVQQKRLLELKAPYWKEWAFTDKSCVPNKGSGSQSIGAGVYHPQSNNFTTVNPGGTNINKTTKQSRASRKSKWP
jgi:hypothetical protein